MGSDVVSLDEKRLMFRDREVFARRLKCIPSRQIADELAITLEEVHQSIARMSGGVSNELRDELRKLELDRLDALQAAWWDRATKEPEAAALVLKMTEMRCKLMKLYLSEDSNADETVRNREKSTDAIERALARVAGKAVGTMIEGEVIK